MKPLLTRLPVGIVITLLCGLMYTTIQQVLRQDANDPQIQMAEDAAEAFANGADPYALVPTRIVDLDRSLSPYLIILDENGKALASSGQLDNQIPTVPQGVLDYAKTHGENRLTWQPRKNVRSAIIVKYFPSTQQRGYIIAGRSLREVEKREAQLAQQIFIGWLITLIVSFIVAGIKGRLLRK